MHAATAAHFATHLRCSCFTIAATAGTVLRVTPVADTVAAAVSIPALTDRLPDTFARSRAGEPGAAPADPFAHARVG